MSRNQSALSETSATTNSVATHPQESSTTNSSSGSTILSTVIALAATTAATGLTLFGLHKLGEQERGVSAKAEGLLAKGQRFLGNEDDAARTRAATFTQNVVAGAKKVASDVEEHTTTAAALVSGCFEGLKK